MSGGVLGNLRGVLDPGRVAEVEKTSNKPKEEVSDVKFATETSADVSYVIEYLLKLHSCKNKNEFRKNVDRSTLSYLASLKDKLVLLKGKLNEAEKANPSVKDFAIIKFCRSIAENDKLHKELSNLAKKCYNDKIHKKLNILSKKYRNVPHATSYERLYPQLGKIVKDFDMHQLQKQISFLKKLKEKSDFNTIRNDYSDKWDFDDLIGDKKFREEYIDKALDEEDESFNKSFKEDLNEYIKLADQAKETAKKYFGEEVKLQAYHAKADDGTSNILNINLIDHGGNESIRISEVLQKEENTNVLNIHHNKKLGAIYSIDKKEGNRYLEVKEGVDYHVITKWRAEDESGNISICKMIMGVDNSGITKIVEFNGRKSELLSEDDLALVEQNKLYIPPHSLHDAVKKFLRSQCGESIRVIEKDTVKMPDVVPVVAGKSLQEDKAIETKQNPNDKGIDANQDFESSTIAVEVKQNPNDKGTDANQDFESSTIAVEVKQNPNDKGTDANQDFESDAAVAVCNTSASEIVTPNQATQVQAVVNGEINSQQAETQTEVELQKTTTETQTEVSTQQAATQTEFHSQQAAAETQTKINTQQIAIQTEIGLPQMDELTNLEQEASKLKKENVELNQAVEAGLQAMNKKHNKLIQEKHLLQKELKATQEENKGLNQELSEISEENELLNNKVGELYRERDDLYEVRCDLQDELERNKQEFIEEKGLLNHRIADGQEKFVQFIRQYGELENKLAETKQIIEELKQQNSDLQTKDIEIVERLEGKNARLQVEKNKMREELAKLNTILKEKAKELDSMYEKKEKAERALGGLNKENSQLKDEVKTLEKDVSTAEEETLKIANERDKIEENFRCYRLKNTEAIEKLQEQNSALKTENYKISEELAKFKKEQKEGTKELEDVYEKKEKAEKALRELSKKNSESNSEADELKKELNQAREYAECLMDEKSKAVQDLKSQMSQLEQNYKEQLKSSAKSVEKQAWEFKELQNELGSKKKKFEEAERAYRELEDKCKELEEAFNLQQIEIGFLKGYKSVLAERLVYIDEMEDMIAQKTQDIEDFQKEIKALKEKIESLNEQVKAFTEANTTDANKIKHLVETNPAFYMLVQALSDVGDIILPKKPLSRSSSPASPEKKRQASRSSSISSVDSGRGSDKENCDDRPSSAPDSNSQGNQYWSKLVGSKSLFDLIRS